MEGIAHHLFLKKYNLSQAYINGMGCISPQHTVDENWFFETIQQAPTPGDFMSAQEPSYKEHIAPNLLRRMGRAIKMGVASANMALQEANVSMVDAIATGTGLGCFEDSERFVFAMIENDEQFLTPTSFIQSTHNTVGSQIALIMKCHDYNFTYVHRGFSFESTMMDAMMWFDEGKKQILIGGIEEHTPTYVELNRKAGKLKALDSSKPFWQQGTKGYQMGEGGAFFVLSKNKQDHSIAAIGGVQTLYKPQSSEVVDGKLNTFLSANHLTLDDIDVVLLGFSGDGKYDQKLNDLLPKFSEKTQTAYFKHLCGEYHTASSFGTWVAAKLIQKQQVPECIKINHKDSKEIKQVLVVNQFLDSNYSFILLQAC